MQRLTTRTFCVLLACILVCSFIFVGCGSGNQAISFSSDYQFLDGASVPSGYSVTENPEGGYLICQGENVIGGIQLLDLTEASESDDYLYHLSDHLIAAAKEIAKQYKSNDYDHMTHPSEYAYKEFALVSADGENFDHFIFETESGYCDLWFDLSHVTRETEIQFIDNLFKMS